MHFLIEPRQLLLDTPIVKQLSCNAEQGLRKTFRSHVLMQMPATLA